MIYIKRWLEYYDELFPVEENQQEFIERLCQDFQAPAKLLNVECGPARLMERMHATHPDITVTDSFQEFISVVNTRQENQENAIHAFYLNPVDIARYLGKEFFNVALCCNYRIIFMKDRTLIKKFLFDVKMLLKDGGYFVIDLINFAKYDFSLSKIELPIKKCERATLYSSLIKDRDAATYNLYQHLVTSSGKLLDETRNEEVCPISMESFKAFAEELKYSSIEFYSDYNGTPYSKDAEKIICVLKK